MGYSSLVQKQRDFFLTGATRDLDFRKQQLKKLKSLILTNSKNLADAMYSDFKKAPLETYISETQLSIEEIGLFLKKLGKWTKSEKVHSTLFNFPSTAFIRKEPYGVALIISPWNYPFQLCMVPLVGAIGAGNCAVIKPSEFTPATSGVIESMINRNFPEDYIHVINGDAQTGKSLLEERFDFIFFTGSSRIGKMVAQSAAVNLTPVVLELGGKSPCIIDKDYDLSLAARRIVLGKFLNCGQTCVAPDYLYVHEDDYDKLIEQLIFHIKNFYGENPELSPDYARVINQSHFDRLKSYIESGMIIYGGEMRPETRYISPTLLGKISWEDKVMQEEIFGPVLPVLTYKNLDEIIEKLKKAEKPLSAYIFSKNRQIQNKILNNLSFGAGAINDTVSQFINPNMPFGGVGQSGLGAYHGKYSFEVFSHHKSILKRGSWIDIPLRYPPYTSFKEKLIKFAFKININT
jgi:aldehyde dehydrogenase (NAD+)